MGFPRLQLTGRLCQLSNETRRQQKISTSQWSPALHKIYCWAATNVGLVRKLNEDAYLTSAQDTLHASASWEGPLQQDGWALVADGMGGHAAGEVASELAVQCLASVLSRLCTAEEVTAAIETANLALFDAMRVHAELAGMGTTIAGVRLLGEFALVFNAGDSRIYHEVGGALKQLSEDHVVGGYMLTKCLGGASVSAPVEPFVLTVAMLKGSRLLLCSDGVTDELADSDIQELVQGPRPADAIVASALAAGGRDNATAVVISVNG